MNDMKPDQKIAQEEMKVCVQETVEQTINRTVNGKIDVIDKKLDAYNLAHEKRFERILPVVEAFEEGQRDLAVAKKGGKLILWLAATITALGGAFLIIRAIFFRV